MSRIARSTGWAKEEHYGAGGLGVATFPLLAPVTREMFDAGLAWEPVFDAKLIA
jgi:hypothetical protein